MVALPPRVSALQSNTDQSRPQSKSKLRVLEERLFRVFERERSLLDRYPEKADQLQNFYTRRSIKGLTNAPLPLDLERRMQALSQQYKVIAKSISLVLGNGERVQTFLQQAKERFDDQLEAYGSETESDSEYEEKEERSDQIAKLQNEVDALRTLYSTFWDTDIKPVKLRLQKEEDALRECTDAEQSGAIQTRIKILQEQLAKADQAMGAHYNNYCLAGKKLSAFLKQ